MIEVRALTAGYGPVTVLRDTPQGVYVTGLPDQVQVITVGQEYVAEGAALDVTLSPAAP